MRPADRNAKSKKGADRRVRQILSTGLGWLQGYPVGEGLAGAVEWRAMGGSRERPDTETLVIDARLLQRASRSLTELTRRFPRALPALVGDVETWAADVTTSLEIFKGAVHRGEPLYTTSWALPTPAIGFPGQLAGLVADLVSLGTRERRRTLALLGRTLPSRTIEACDAWWDDVQEIAQEVRRPLANKHLSRENHALLDVAVQHFKLLQDDRPLAYDFESHKQAIRFFA